MIKTPVEIHKSDLRIMFMPTLNPGDVYYRIISIAKYMRRVDKTIVAYEPVMYNDEYCYKWEWRMDKDTSLVANKLQNIIEKEIKPNIIIYQKVCLPKTLAMIQVIRETYNIPAFLEVDDYNIGINSENYAYSAYNPGSQAEKVFFEQMKISDGIIVSTPFLQKEFSKYNKNVTIMRNGIDFEVWDKLKDKGNKKIEFMTKLPIQGREHERVKDYIKPKDKGEIRIGWAGGSAHSKDLLILKDVIRIIVKKYKNVKFYFAGGAPDDIKYKNVKIHICWVPINEYPQFLKDCQFDIGLFPLYDNNFNRAKSNLRWLEYSALKIPTIASNTAEASRTIQDGYTGLIVKNETEYWVEAISKLVEDRKTRLLIGENAYNEVKKNYNCKQIGEEYVEHIKKQVRYFRRDNGK